MRQFLPRKVFHIWYRCGTQRRLYFESQYSPASPLTILQCAAPFTGIFNERHQGTKARPKKLINSHELPTMDFQFPFRSAHFEDWISKYEYCDFGIGLMAGLNITGRYCLRRPAHNDISLPTCGTTFFAFLLLNCA